MRYCCGWATRRGGVQRTLAVSWSGGGYLADTCHDLSLGIERVPCDVATIETWQIEYGMS